MSEASKGRRGEGAALAADALHVLVIDDEDGVRDLLSDILHRRGHQAVLAASAEEGLELLPFWTFQIAFIDHHLPGMDGLVLGEYLRRHNPDMTIALVTGEADARLERRSRDLSIRFLAKPFAVSDIESVVDEYLSRAQDRAVQSVRDDSSFVPEFAPFLGDITACYDMPHLPSRIQERLVATLRRCLNDLRASARYTERDRVVALTGLLSAQLLGVELPRMPSGRTLFQEYDDIMRKRGKRVEFGDD